MGFLANLFKSKAQFYIEELYKNAKLQTEELKKENKKLLNELQFEREDKKRIEIELIKVTAQAEQQQEQKTKPKTLTPLEKKVLTVILDNPTLKNKEIAAILKLSEGSLQVYKSKVRKKGFL
jgi:DNA-binding CsgD family transcriptional regulator